MAAATVTAWGFKMNWAAYSSPRLASDVGFADHQAGRGGHKQRRDLTDQTFADGQERKSLGRVFQGHAMLQNPDDEPPDDVDGHDDDGRRWRRRGRTCWRRPWRRRTPLPARSCAPRRASSSSMRPALRSASMAICLPGIASRVKRAATSVTRSAPLVMTMNWMTTRMRKTTSADDEVAARPRTPRTPG